jgi:hypothetical protein
MIKFKSVFERYTAAEFSQLEAAELLGMSERTFRGYGDSALNYSSLARASVIARPLPSQTGDSWFFSPLRCAPLPKKSKQSPLCSLPHRPKSHHFAPLQPFRITPKAQQLCMAAIESYSLCIAANARIFHLSTAAVLRSSSQR